MHFYLFVGSKVSKVLLCEDVFYIALTSLHDQDAAHDASNTLQQRRQLSGRGAKAQTE